MLRFDRVANSEYKSNKVHLPYNFLFLRFVTSWILLLSLWSILKLRTVLSMGSSWDTLYITQLEEKRFYIIKKNNLQRMIQGTLPYAFMDLVFPSFLLTLLVLFLVPLSTNGKLYLTKFTFALTAKLSATQYCLQYPAVYLS